MFIYTKIPTLDLSHMKDKGYIYTAGLERGARGALRDRRGHRRLLAPSPGHREGTEMGVEGGPRAPASSAHGTRGRGPGRDGAKRWLACI